MKNLMMTLLFSACSLMAAAQTFDEKTFLDIMQGGIKDPVKYLQTETTPDFMFIGTGGYVFDLKTFIGMNENATSENRVFSNVKARQYGNTGIATGILSHTIKPKKAGESRSESVLFAYVFVEQKGKWLWASMQHSEGPTDPKQDEAGIKAVIEKETQAFLDRDVAAMIDCHANKPYSLFLVGEHGNVHYMTSPNADLDKTFTTILKQLGKPNGDTYKNKDYVIRINGNSAFVYFDQTAINAVASDNKNKEPEISHQTRYLERINGSWKLVYVGGLGAKP